MTRVVLPFCACALVPAVCQAVWNGNLAAVARLLSPVIEGHPSPLYKRLSKNVPLRCLSGSPMTELDLALMQHFDETAIMLGMGSWAG